MSLRSGIEQKLIPFIAPSFPNTLVYLLLTNKIAKVGYFIIMLVHGPGDVNVWHWCWLLLRALRGREGGRKEGTERGKERGVHINALITILQPTPIRPNLLQDQHFQR